MSIRLDKPWQPLSALNDVKGQLGVFQLGDGADDVIYIGYAGGRSRFGLHSAIAEASEAIGGAASYRLEITSAYWTRYQELLMVHQADHGELPRHNTDVPRLGRLSPA